MALKLEVPWRREPLEVDYPTINSVIGEIETSGGRHVQTVGADVIVKNFFEVNSEVPDVSRYRIGDDGQLVHHCDVPESRLHIHPQLGSIVLLLESPYKDEYQFRNINCPIAPARGKTGDNIHRCLDTVLSHIEAERIVPGYKVIISNPIQFQTSLHAIHGQSVRESTGKWKRLRNYVWLNLWGDGEEKYIKQCFLARLGRYYPKVIINACTGAQGCGDEDPKGLVNAFVQAEFPNAHHYETPHPVTWNSRDCNICIHPIPPPADFPE